MEVAELDKFLAKMWAELRRVDGSFYSKKTMMTIKYGIQRHFSMLREVDIGADEAFKNSRKTFSGMMSKLKQAGKGIRHKDVISFADFQGLYFYLDLDSPQGLQDKVFVDVMIFFCNKGMKGRESLREFNKTDFAVGTDEKGAQFLYITRDLRSKKHQNDDAQSGSGTIYEVPGNPRCPVSSFLKYLSKLNPSCQALWQRPKSKEQIIAGIVLAAVWYDNAPVGKNTLGNKMKVLSKQAGLSKVYTNHCLRSTRITALDYEQL